MAAKKSGQRSAASRERTSAGAAASRRAVDEAKAGKAKARKAPAKKKKAVGEAPARAVRAEQAPRARGTAAAQPLAAPVIDHGDRAPSFELLDQSGASVSSAELAGRPYVLYFYPKDDTPGCTTEACEFRDALPAFEELDVRVIGVSPDSTMSHEKFRVKYSLPFTLLSDSDKQLSSAYGVWARKQNYGREYMGIVRSTFLVGADGLVRKAWRGVRVKGHVEQVRDAATALDGES